MQCPDCGFEMEAGHDFDDNAVCKICGYDRKDINNIRKDMDYTGLWVFLGISAAITVAVLVKKRKNK